MGRMETPSFHSLLMAHLFFQQGYGFAYNPISDTQYWSGQQHMELPSQAGTIMQKHLSDRRVSPRAGKNTSTCTQPCSEGGGHLPEHIPVLKVSYHHTLTWAFRFSLCFSLYFLILSHKT